jgi:hypothetical protein
MTNHNTLELYDEIAAKHNAAYAAFREIHTAKNPQPVKARTERSDWLVSLALAVLVAASVVVSGSRTIVEFGGGIVGLMGFVMLELGIVSYAFIRTKSHMTEARLQSVQRWTNFGLLLAFVVAVAANVHATLGQAGVPLPEGINALILLLLGISAPTLAVISGDILAVEFLKAANRKARIERDYAEAYAQWTDGLNRAWASQQARWGVRVEIKSEPLSIHSSSLNERVNERVNERLITATSGYTKRMDARAVIEDFFIRHPERMDAKLDELVVEITQQSGVKVGRTSIHNVRRSLRGAE